ncbi:ATPase WRNIP1 isoform X4 [Orussus abietinus]|uniref:ATPase WRNIP1 isoform X4 n=1 Tax=Orussus abietinus TaxID=222816 RepID=UPI00062657B6|nr:ATPase WRNIP1 isoform X4 [Orussus abietinus]
MACDKNKRIRLLEGVKLEPPTKKYKVQSGMQGEQKLFSSVNKQNVLVSSNKDYRNSMTLKESYVSLIEKIRPTNPEEYIGQKHILSLHSVLYQLIRHKELPSMILWGPPGCGKKLSTTDSISILERAVKSTKGKILTTLEDLNCNSVAAPAFTVDEETIKWLAVTCDGDIRVALSSLNWAIQSKVFNRNAVLSKNQLYPIEVKDLKEGLQEVHVFNDKENNLYYDMISALHKCIRANKANAALYWLARIMADGHDPVYIAKRLVRISSEEVGLADIDALGIAVHTMHGCQMLGMPECDILLAQCVVYLARAPKSRLIPNALEIAHKVILNHNGLHPPVPLHMRCKPRDAQLMSVIETAKENSLKEENLNQNCLPPELKNTNFFKEESLDAE